MRDVIDLRARIWAAIAVATGLALYIALDLIEDPDSTPLDIVLNLVEVTPLVLTTVGLVLLFLITRRQRDEHVQVIRDLELARVRGERWRSEARTHLMGLGEAIETQFSRWNLTEAEREVALLLLKGLSTKEVAAVRATSERTVREQARSVYSKAGLTGRAALSAFFLEDLLAPIEGVGSSSESR
ncbi:MAG: helix-turn-helix transcriptional regulator [Gammaproteobacteria bacterium]